MDISKGDDAASWRFRVAELTGLRGARINPGWDGLRALTIAAVVAALASGVVGWRSRPQQGAPPVRLAPRGGVTSTAVPSEYLVAGVGVARRAVIADAVRV